MQGYFQFTTLELTKALNGLDLKKAKKIGFYAVVVGLAKGVVLALVFTSANKMVSSLFTYDKTI